MEERRKSKRLELEGDLFMTALDKGAQPQKVEIDIINCSRSGLGFTSKLRLPIGDNYEVYLKIWTGSTIHAFLKIIRMKELSDSFEYGSYFVGMTDADAQRISIYETVENFSGQE